MEYSERDGNISDRHSKLTARERDCLQLLSAGLLSSEVRAELGISQSTLETHLATARRKLGVRTTIQAVLRFGEEALSQRRPRNGEAGFATVGPSEHLSEMQVRLLDNLSFCQTFEQAWKALHDYLVHFGIGAFNFVLVADPKGVIEESNWTFRSSLPEEITAQHREMGSVPADPDAAALVKSGVPRTLDLETLYPFLIDAPRPMREMASLLIDSQAHRQLGLISRDRLTEARYFGCFVFNGHGRKQFESAVEAHSSELKQALELFWGHIERNALLSRELKLTARESEALLLLARGFAVSEMAERIRVSQRAAEQFLARARRKLGARNNAQAIYRALVYRALH